MSEPAVPGACKLNGQALSPMEGLIEGGASSPAARKGVSPGQAAQLQESHDHDGHELAGAATRERPAASLDGEQAAPQRRRRLSGAPRQGALLVSVPRLRCKRKMSSAARRQWEQQVLSDPHKQDNQSQPQPSPPESEDASQSQPPLQPHSQASAAAGVGPPEVDAIHPSKHSRWRWHTKG